MKNLLNQFPMKLVQKSLTLLISAACGVFLTLLTHATAENAIPPPYAAYFNPENGFKPAQRDLTKIVLQMAGSLEHFGTPEHYIRHVMGEHTRIAAKYKAATGKDITARPDYLTDEFVDHLLANWKKLTPGLKLDELCRKSGRNMRLAIMGTWNMPVSELLAQETKLNDAEKREFARFLAKDYFTKADLPDVDRFYQDGGGYDKLSEISKARMSKRIERGIMTPDKRAADIKNDLGGSLAVKLLNSHQAALMDYLTTDSKKPVNGDTLLATLKTGLRLNLEQIELKGMDEYERDAFQFSHAIQWDFNQRFQYIRNAVKPAEEAEGTVRSIYAMVENLSVIANLEFRAAIIEMEVK